MYWDDALEAAGWTWDGQGWTDPSTGDWYETDREAAAALERGNSRAYDSNYYDEWR